MAIARVTQVTTEALLKEPSKARVTQLANEVLLKEPSKARVTQIALEVLVSTALPVVSTNQGAFFLFL